MTDIPNKPELENIHVSEPVDVASLHEPVYIQASEFPSTKSTYGMYKGPDGGSDFIEIREVR